MERCNSKHILSATLRTEAASFEARIEFATVSPRSQSLANLAYSPKLTTVPSPQTSVMAVWGATTVPESWLGASAFASAEDCWDEEDLEDLEEGEIWEPHPELDTGSPVTSHLAQDSDTSSIVDEDIDMQEGGEEQLEKDSDTSSIVDMAIDVQEGGEECEEEEPDEMDFTWAFPRGQDAEAAAEPVRGQPPHPAWMADPALAAAAAGEQAPAAAAAPVRGQPPRPAWMADPALAAIAACGG